MTFKKGDFLTINYTGKNAEDGQVFDTTLRETAEKEKVLDEKKEYKPLNLILGENEVLPGLEKTLESMKVGEKKKVELLPKEAFGERDSKLVSLVPLKEFKKRKMEPFPGLVVDLNGQVGKVQTVSGGRVRVDFNHPLAGKTVQFEVKVEKQITEKKEKIMALVNKFFPDLKEKDWKLEGKTLQIKQEIQQEHEKVIQKIVEKHFTKNLPVEKVLIAKEFKKTKKDEKKETEKNEKKPKKG